MATSLATTWGFVINNPDENDYLIVRQGYPDYVRSLVHTTEVGKGGTEHIQGYLKLQKQQRMSFVKKLFPKANLTPLTKDEYEFNTKQYVQKNDETTAGPHIQQFNPPTPDAVQLLKDIMEQYVVKVSAEYDPLKCRSHYMEQERALVEKEPNNAKLIISAQYQKIKNTFLKQIYENIIYKHTDRNENYAAEDEEDDEEASDEESEDGSQSDQASESGSEESSEGSATDEGCSPTDDRCRNTIHSGNHK